MREKPIILITAGGTSEPIDSVRSITNTGTGKLGSMLADTLATELPHATIFYVCARSAVKPNSPRMQLVEIQTVHDLQTAVLSLTQEHCIDVVIHSMAVSDYTVASVTSVDSLARSVQELSSNACDAAAIQQLLRNSDMRAGGKFSSHETAPLILLEQTQKILPLFRQKLPNAVIIGFKLLSGVPQTELIETAHRLLANNGCDFVLANDSTQIAGDNHTAHLVDAQKKTVSFKTKQEIARGITQAVVRKLYG
ncbi:MAG: phosphopantothenoylcysteine synthase [Treponema sp.]|nr:phosphopantothenoylcysteine synthase [Treponema sp.]